MSEIQPRLMRVEDAARYVGLSVSAFRSSVVPKIRKLHPQGTAVAYLRDDLDRWIDDLAGIDRTPITQPAAKVNPLDALV